MFWLFDALLQAMNESWSKPFLNAFSDSKNIHLYEVFMLEIELYLCRMVSHSMHGCVIIYQFELCGWVLAVARICITNFEYNATFWGFYKTWIYFMSIHCEIGYISLAHTTSLFLPQVFVLFYTASGMMGLDAYWIFIFRASFIDLL